MKKKALVIGLCLCVFATAFALVGCAKETKPEPLQITDSGWYAPEPSKYSDSSYVHYGVSVYNPNENYYCDYVTVSITGKDENGEILFSDTQTMGVVNPTETITFGNQAGNGKRPATVEFEAYVKDSDWGKINKDKAVIPSYEITNTNVTETTFGDVDFTGKIKVDDSWGKNESAWVSVILKDADGKTITGDHTFVNVVKNSDVPFEISVSSRYVPEYASFEIYAYPWY